MESLGRYRLLSRLGSGGFSTVWLGFDDDLDIHVAIKVLADNWVGSGDISQRFLDEARLLRRVADQRVVRVHDIGWDSGRPYFVMDYISGGTLAELNGLPLPAGQALALTSEIARAIQVLHDHEVMHRDVKPSNILLTGTTASQVVVADLGMAKRLAEGSGVTMSVGTPSFMAPEQAHGQTGLDVRVDVYAVAAVGYLLLTGRRPFPDCKSVVEVAVRPPTAAPASLVGQLREADPTLDVAALDELLRAALAYDPARRPATAAALAGQLDALAAPAESSQLTRPTEIRLVPEIAPLPSPPVSGPQFPAQRRRSSTVALAAVVLVIAAAFTWIGLSLALA